MVRLAQGFPIQQVLLVKIDLRELVMSHLHFDPTGGTGRIPSTVVIQGKTKRFGRV
jgi:hypothetical protein